jgi:hypothetical protein
MPIQKRLNKQGCAALLVSMSLLCAAVYTVPASAGDSAASSSEPAAKPKKAKKKKACAADASPDDKSCLHQAHELRPLGSPPPGPVHSK